jgi:cell fate (sporulation/competence/biofilm development) regulator YlbF (YheA/YmcA/DUF963 family)
MKYLFLLLLTGCTLNAQKQDLELQKDAKFNELIANARKNQVNFNEVHRKAKEKEDKIVAQTISKIVTLKEEVLDLKTEISDMKIRIDTIYIHDTIQIKEKKNFWGKTKTDTTNNK